MRLVSVSEVLHMALAAVLAWKDSSSAFSRIVVLSPLIGGACLALPMQLEERSVSFHMLLHRFLAACVAEACKFDHLNSSLRSLQLASAPNPTELGSVADCALMCVSAASQIRVGMWRRNGYCMQDQLLNYGDAPFCHKYRDRDVLLLQVIATQYPSIYFTGRIFHRFGLQQHLEAYHLFGGCRLKTDPDAFYLPQMMDECLKLLINIVTELPGLPMAAGSKSDMTNPQIMAAVRRELVREYIFTM
jgi:hypothetical protein